MFILARTVGSFIGLASLAACAVPVGAEQDEESAPTASASDEQFKPPVPEPTCMLVDGAMRCEGDACTAYCGPYSHQGGTCYGGQIYRRGTLNKNGFCCDAGGSCAACNAPGHFKCTFPRPKTTKPGSVSTSKAP